MKHRFGILTGGGDCPGLNAAIRAVTRKAYESHADVVGFRFGWKGLIENDYVALDLDSVSGILPRGGTILGSSRTNPFDHPHWMKAVVKNFEALNLDALMVIGGDGTLRAAHEVSEKLEIPLIGIPKTIDNDIFGTDATFGFDTAVSIATEAMDRLHTTAESHQRVMIVEVMGRNTGWIAVASGIASGADFILIPEVSVTLESILESLEKRHARGKTFSIIVVAEGAQFDCADHERVHKGREDISKSLAFEIQQKTNDETRVTILGHVQRGGSPTAYDRILATQFGIHAVALALNQDFGKMVALQGRSIIPIPLKQAVQKTKTCDLKFFDIAKSETSPIYFAFVPNIDFNWGNGMPYGITGDAFKIKFSG
ncbi:MAG: 6-phosphofructokinase, partial [Deltaproteobacteria bacterium]|nr:6-phosphofructokinase [Deltaproteobacteria bacterium]